MSYNLPKFCPNATWNPNAITFANEADLSEEPIYIFVNTRNTVYTVVNSGSTKKVWIRESGGSTTITANVPNEPKSLFVNILGEIYIDHSPSDNNIGKWLANLTGDQNVMYVAQHCHGLFIDGNNSLYCSMESSNQVVRQSLNVNGANQSVVADQLNNPHGIFVDFQFKLYVADTDNNRIRCFTYGNRSGVTLAGNGTTNTITLNEPTGVVLDADKNLFIVDMNNHRIIGQGPNGFRCVAGCFSSNPKNTPNQLNQPTALNFDSHGNIFVADSDNKRIQKFLLMTNSCSK